MKSKHTPGPWGIVRLSNGGFTKEEAEAEVEALIAWAKETS